MIFNTIGLNPNRRLDLKKRNGLGLRRVQWDCAAEQGFNACGEKDRFFDERVLGGIVRTAMEL